MKIITSELFRYRNNSDNSDVLVITDNRKAALFKDSFINNIGITCCLIITHTTSVSSPHHPSRWGL